MKAKKTTKKSLIRDLGASAAKEINPKDLKNIRGGKKCSSKECETLVIIKVPPPNIRSGYTKHTVVIV
ncbi:MAG: hypothetical protein NTV82_16680 [Candidatus Aminicenantes bacterium]|jgi:hypothetical protein|nr:hypothetical protein [Candidatus Aminicenantes bacterium]